jgi:hypothetical protein
MMPMGVKFSMMGGKLKALLSALSLRPFWGKLVLVTYDQVEARKEKAVRFLRDVVGDDDRADEVEDESVEDYADRKNLTIKNTATRVTRNAGRRTNDMANGDTKADLQDAIDQATQILSDAYTPESSREDLAAAVGDALDALSGDGGDDDDDVDDSDDSDVVSNARDDAY